jgi:hypothetical protein
MIEKVGAKRMIAYIGMIGFGVPGQSTKSNWDPLFALLGFPESPDSKHQYPHIIEVLHTGHVNPDIK